MRSALAKSLPEHRSVEPRVNSRFGLGPIGGPGIFALGLSLLVAACGRSDASLPPSLTPSPSPTRSLAPTISPTMRGQATQRQYGSATAQVGPTATSSPTPSAEQIVATITAGSVPEVEGTYPSPDGRWRAQVLIYPCVTVGGTDELAYEVVSLRDNQDGLERIVDSQLQYCGGLGAYGFEGRFWSTGSRFLYYTDAREGVPDGCGYWMPPLLRVDTDDWTVEELGAGPLSPDREMIATWRGDELAIWQTEGDRIAAVRQPVPGAIPGPIAWSPDARSIIFLLSADYCPLGETYVGRVDLVDMAPVVLLSSQAPSFADVQWDSPNRISLADEQNNKWTYDFATGQLRRVPP